MIKTNELRIGNLIADYECEPYFFEVEQIRKHVGSENWVYYRNGSIKSKEPEPIPLTEEWLLKFGFEWYEPYKSFTYKRGERINGKNIEMVIEGKGWYICDMDFTPSIKYVHQLQNLYFALTGEELVIK